MSNIVLPLVALNIASCILITIIVCMIGYVVFSFNPDQPEQPSRYESDNYYKKPNNESQKISNESNQVCKIVSKSGKSYYLPKPWYANPANPTQCFAPAGQKCCNQVAQGCMQEFLNVDDDRMTQWYETCPLSYNQNKGLSSAPLPSETNADNFYRGTWSVQKTNDSTFKLNDVLKIGIEDKKLTLTTENDIGAPQFGIYLKTLDKVAGSNPYDLSKWLGLTLTKIDQNVISVELMREAWTFKLTAKRMT